MGREITITLPTDEQGFVGRQCPNPSCRLYFKVKPGTGLPTEECICPYCGHKQVYGEFLTDDQLEYAKSIAIKEFVEPEIRKLEQSLKGLERSTRGSFIQIKAHVRRQPFRLAYYQEQKLETHVTCDNCGLEFAIYGVFAGCPDCGQLNALRVFEKSIEVARKRLALLDTLEEEDDDLPSAMLEDALSVSAFDSLGKALRRAYPNLLPDRPRNLFQNLTALSDALSNTNIGRTLADIIGHEEADFLKKMFQVRHIFEHNMGVVDEDYVQKVPGSAHLKGRRYKLERDEVERFLETLLNAGRKVEAAINQR